MKKIIVIAALFMAAFGAYAQDCEAIMLPYFKGNVERMISYRDNTPDKFMYRCIYAQSAFYESDTIPEGTEVLNISQVKEWLTGNFLPLDIVIDLNTFSFYAYNFGQIQVRHDSVTERTCFATPGSHHPYLVLRSVNEMNELTDRLFKEYNINRQ